jgi:acetyl-CoA acetyltransferase
MLTEHAMRRTGATREDFGKLCIAQRANAARNPDALLRAPLAMVDYLAARPIASPLHLYDCVMPCAGAEGFLVMHRARADTLGLRAARILGTIERHNAYPDDPVQWRGGWAVDRDALWRTAGIGPGDVDCVQTYDDYPVIVMMQFEDLGFCAKDGGPEFIRRHDFTIAGNFPHNTGGGQLSAGQAGAAGGFLGVVEALRQVTGTAGERQVARVRHALASGFGMINYDRGLCTSAAVLGA